MIECSTQHNWAWTCLSGWAEFGQISKTELEFGLTLDNTLLRPNNLIFKLRS